MNKPSQKGAGSEISQKDIEKHTLDNLTPAPQKSNSTATVQRDAAAMVQILDKMKSGWEPFEIVYESLKDKHGARFEFYFREILSGRESVDG